MYGSRLILKGSSVPFLFCRPEGSSGRPLTQFFNFLLLDRCRLNKTASSIEFVIVSLMVASRCFFSRQIRSSSSLLPIPATVDCFATAAVRYH